MRSRILGVTAACAITGAQAEDQEGRVQVGNTEVKGSIDRPASVTSDHQTAVSKVNKASALIGMDVRNSQNERLGEIKDLVLDLQSGKVSYAVLSVGGFLGIGDKYVAVPPGAFHVAPDQGTLVLNADKAKIQNAPGFAKSTWPDVNSTTWNTDSAYWLDNTAQGTIGTTRTGTDAARSSSDLDRPVTSTDSSRTTLDRTIDARTESATLNERNTFRGRITAINPETRTLTVEGASGTREFKLTDKPALALKENRNPSLTDFKVGFPVSVGFHEEGGAFMAHSLIRTDAPEVK